MGDKKMRYNYPRADVTIRVSGELLNLLHEIKTDLNVTMQDDATMALLMATDPSAAICPDWWILPTVLRPEMKPPTGVEKYVSPARRNRRVPQYSRK